MALNTPPGSRPLGPRRPPAATLTEVELVWFEKTLEHWIRFGRVRGEQFIDRHRRVLRFEPGSRFAHVRWASNDYGTIVSRIDILRAVAPGEAYSTVPFVRPGAEILLHIEGWPKVERVLAAIDGVDALGVDPADVSPDHWRHVHNRIAAGHQPRVYDLSGHRAWLARRALRS